MCLVEGSDLTIMRNNGLAFEFRTRPHSVCVHDRRTAKRDWQDEQAIACDNREVVMIQMMRALGATAVVVASCLGSQAVAQTKQLTLCWAAWDPANALVELSKDFTTKTGVQMKYEFVPWTSYADRFLNELNSKGKLCDVIIGDSQWIGGAAQNGHYVKLNDFFLQEKISSCEFIPSAAVVYD